MTNAVIRSIPTLLVFPPRTVTRAAGDLISSDTAGGTDGGRTPQKFMHPGEAATIGVEGIGYLTTPVVAGCTGDATERRKAGD